MSPMTEAIMSINHLSWLIDELRKENKELREEVKTLQSILFSYQYATGMEQVEGKMWRPVSGSEATIKPEEQINKLNECNWVNELSKQGVMRCEEGDKVVYRPVNDWTTGETVVR